MGWDGMGLVGIGGWQAGHDCKREKKNNRKKAKKINKNTLTTWPVSLASLSRFELRKVDVTAKTWDTDATNNDDGILCFGFVGGRWRVS